MQLQQCMEGSVLYFEVLSIVFINNLKNDLTHQLFNTINYNNLLHCRKTVIFICTLYVNTFRCSLKIVHILLLLTVNLINIVFAFLNFDLLNNANIYCGYSIVMEFS